MVSNSSFIKSFWEQTKHINKSQPVTANLGLLYLVISRWKPVFLAPGACFLLRWDRKTTWKATRSLSEAQSIWRWQKLGHIEKQGIGEEFRKNRCNYITKKGKPKDILAIWQNSKRLIRHIPERRETTKRLYSSERPKVSTKKMSP